MSTTDNPTRTGRLVDIIRITVAVILGGIGGAAGFTHSHDWAVANGQHGWIAWAVAVVIEGMVVVAGFEIHADRHRPGPPPRHITFPVVVLVAGFGIQMTAQVALAPPTPAGWLIAAMPALGFLVVVKLLMRRAPTATPASVPADSRTTPTPTPTTQLPPTPTPPAPSAGPAPEPARPQSPPSRLPGVKLPAHLADQITATVDEIRAAGNEPTTDDIRRVVKIPEAMATRILDQLTPRNGHPAT